MKNKSRITLALTLLSPFFFVGCEKHNHSTQGEKITKVQIHLKGSGIDKEFIAEDNDVDGIFNTIQEVVLPPNATLEAFIHVYDENTSLDDEIEAEKNDHLFTFSPNPPNLLFITLNTDSNGLPFGQSSTWTTGTPSSGSIQIKLIHEPTNKTNNIDPGGETDFDVTFPVKVQ
jgi:hypothetical protein